MRYYKLFVHTYDSYNFFISVKCILAFLLRYLCFYCLDNQYKRFLDFAVMYIDI